VKAPIFAVQETDTLWKPINFLKSDMNIGAVNKFDGLRFMLAHSRKQLIAPRLY
jgi:hypothetical protein